MTSPQQVGPRRQVRALKREQSFQIVSSELSRYVCLFAFSRIWRCSRQSTHSKAIRSRLFDPIRSCRFSCPRNTYCHNIQLLHSHAPYRLLQSSVLARRTLAIVRTRGRRSCMGQWTMLSRKAVFGGRAVLSRRVAVVYLTLQSRSTKQLMSGFACVSTHLLWRAFLVRFSKTCPARFSVRVCFSVHACLFQRPCRLVPVAGMTAIRWLISAGLPPLWPVAPT